MGAIKTWSSEDLINSLIPATVALHLSEATRALGLITLFSWIILQLIRQIKQCIDQHARREAWLSRVIFLGLVLFNSRNILLRENYRGPTIFLLIAAGFLIGSHFNQRQWHNLLAWLSISVIPIALFFTIQSGHPGAWITSSTECKGHLGDSGVFCTYYKLVQPSMGSINRLATLMTFLTLSAWYSCCLAFKNWERLGHLVITALGYLITLGTESRMAIIAVTIGVLLPWLGLRLHQRLSPKRLTVSLITTTTVIAIAAWELVVKHDLGSDAMRLQQASCWIRQGMLKSAERFWMGSGYDTNSLREACHYINPDRSFGHAHNTIAQIAGNHGLLGLIGLVSFTALIIDGLWKQVQTKSNHLTWSPWGSTNWSEISLAFNLALIFCALSTTVQEFSPVNQVLIGIVAGMACLSTRPEQPVKNV